jgi:hypothetical protein
MGLDRSKYTISQRKGTIMEQEWEVTEINSYTDFYFSMHEGTASNAYQGEALFAQVKKGDRAGAIFLITPNGSMVGFVRPNERNEFIIADEWQMRTKDQRVQNMRIFWENRENLPRNFTILYNKKRIVKIGGEESASEEPSPLDQQSTTIGITVYRKCDRVEVRYEKLPYPYDAMFWSGVEGQPDMCRVILLNRLGEHDKPYDDPNDAIKVVPRTCLQLRKF